MKDDIVDRNAAKVWIIQNQFGRRNLHDIDRAKLALVLEPLFLKEADANRDQGWPRRGGEREKRGRKAPLIKTALESQRGLAERRGWVGTRSRR